MDDPDFGDPNILVPYFLFFRKKIRNLSSGNGNFSKHDSDLPRRSRARRRADRGAFEVCSRYIH
jgi:hypothetical protein